MPYTRAALGWVMREAGEEACFDSGYGVSCEGIVSQENAGIWTLFEPGALLEMKLMLLTPSLVTGLSNLLQ